jgi:lipopolysaccharide export LptBFGC system permease protein LptF
MKQSIYQAVVPVARIAVVVAFFSAIFLVQTQPACAATAKNKSAPSSKSAVERTEERIKVLQAALKITEPQEIVWNNLAQAMRDNAKEMDAFAKESAERSKSMNSVDRMKYHSQITEVQLAQQKRFIPPFESFYTSLTDEQKKITDTIFQTGKHGKHRIQ